jgi:hypothetical protein
VQRAGRAYWLGRLQGREVILALSRIGKVAAATTATTLVEAFDARRIVFTGVAGGLGRDVHIGDLVVADGFVQHDMDASPLFPRFEIPLYGQTGFACDAELSEWLAQACRASLGAAPPSGRAPGLHRGLIVSGDQFVSTAQLGRGFRAPCAMPAWSRWRSRWRAPQWPRSATTTTSRSRPCAPSPTARTKPRRMISSISSPMWRADMRAPSSTSSCRCCRAAESTGRTGSYLSQPRRRKYHIGTMALAAISNSA